MEEADLYNPVLEGGAIIIADRNGRLLDKAVLPGYRGFDESTLSRYAALLAAITEAAGGQIGLGRPMEIEVAFTNTRVRLIVEDELVRILVE